MENKIVYISGKVSGLPTELVTELFNEAECKLREQGHKVVNVIKEIGFDPSKTWQDYMKEDIILLMECNAIYLLKNWQSSVGARLEKTIAETLGYEMIYEI